MITLPDFDPVAYLVHRRYPHPKSPLAKRYGPWSDEPEPSDPADWLCEKLLFEHELKSLSADELASLVAKAQEEDAAKARAEADARERRYFFNRPKAAADFGHWAKASYWTLDESTALSFGKSPAVVNWQKVEEHVAVSKFAAAYALRRDLIIRACEIGQLLQCNLPGFFIAWTKRNGLEFPVELEAAVVAHGHQIGDWKTAYDAASEAAEHWKKRYEEATATTQRTARLAEPTGEIEGLETRERDSLLKLIIGMAVAGYRFDPKAAKNKATAEIASDLGLLGISMHPDTVRKWLGEAAAQLPQQPD